MELVRATIPLLALLAALMIAALLVLSSYGLGVVPASRGLKPNRRWALALSGTKRVTS